MRAQGFGSVFEGFRGNYPSVKIVEVFPKPRDPFGFGNGDCQRVSDIVLSSISAFADGGEKVRVHGRNRYICVVMFILATEAAPRASEMYVVCAIG